jgi:hypothetical protein
MKKIMNYVVIPFWAQHFSTLRVDENVNQGRFRIGQLILETKVNNCFMIIAELTPSPKEEIQDISVKVTNALNMRIKQFNDGLICAGEFLNEVTILIVDANKDVNNSTCNMRLPSCGKCPATKIKGDEAHEALEQSHYEWLNAHRNLK